MKIYTKTGDSGQTSLFGGKRVSKANLRVEAYGTVDELNSMIGVVVSMGHGTKDLVDKTLLKIQSDLFEIGSALATPGDRIQETSVVLAKRVKEFEGIIDKMTEVLPELHNFILPGGASIAAQLHLARSVARRAERRVIALSVKEVIDTEIIVYFNRLSDLLFTMARFVNHQENKKEMIWEKII